MEFLWEKFDWFLAGLMLGTAIGYFIYPWLYSRPAPQEADEHRGAPGISGAAKRRPTAVISINRRRRDPPQRNDTKR